MRETETLTDFASAWETAASTPISRWDATASEISKSRPVSEEPISTMISTVPRPRFLGMTWADRTKLKDMARL